MMRRFNKLGSAEPYSNNIGEISESRSPGYVGRVSDYLGNNVNPFEEAIIGIGALGIGFALSIISALAGNNYAMAASVFGSTAASLILTGHGAYRS
jgi:hypothetical protein